MLLGPQDKIAGHTPEYVWDVACTHCNAYQYDDIDRLMGTVSPRGGIWSGLLESQGAVIIRTADEVRETYTKALAAVKISAFTPYSSFATDWYVLTVGATTIVEKATGNEIPMTGIGIYGADELGLAIDTDVGSILTWERTDNGPSRPLNDRAAHERRLAAVRSGDAAGAASGVGDTLDLFLPVFDPDDETLQTSVDGPAALTAYWERFGERYEIRSSKTRNQLTTDQFVFSELEWSLADRASGDTVPVRFAYLELLTADGAIRGGIGVAIRS